MPDEELRSVTIEEDGFDTARAQHPWQTLKRLWQAAEDQHGRLLWVLLAVIGYTILSIAAPWYSASVVDLLWETIKTAQSVGMFFTVTLQQGGREILLLLAMYLGSWACYSCASYLMVSFAEKLNRNLRQTLGEKLSRLPLSYYDRRQTGETLSRFTNDMDKMAEAFQYGALRLVSSVVLIVGSVVMMLWFNVPMTLLFLAFTLGSMGMTRVFSRATLKRAARRQEALARLTGLVEEGYSGRTVLKAFGREEASLGDLKAAAEELAQATERADFSMNAINPAVRLVNRLGQLAIGLFAGWQLLQGRLTVGVFQAFFQYVNQSAEPLTELAYVLNSMQSALAAAEGVFALLDEEEEPPDPSLPEKLGQVRGEVTFRHVSFGYTPQQRLMKDISFTARPGEKIAIVGATGAGKTTLINLLMGFYPPDGGEILLDGVDTARLTRADLRSAFAMVLQDTWLFDGTLAENIAYGRPEATREEVIAAAKMARVDFFARTLSKGYDTRITGEGEKLSAGQRQLLTIARAALRDPAVLILDEATSSVDTRTEQEIVRAMEALLQGRTSFVIAHRLSTIVDADRILVMDRGDIIEQGNHRELLAAGGAYAALYNSQFAEG